jgi:HEPN domain-containing protein
MSNDRKELEEQVYKWIEIAEEDLLLAKHAFTLQSNIPYRLICYHAQQCAEKYMKAFLVSKFIDFPYTHSIDALTKLAPEEFKLMTKLESTFKLTNYAVARRYPGEYQKIDKDDAQNAVKLAEFVKEIIYELLEKDNFKLSN